MLKEVILNNTYPFESDDLGAFCWSKKTFTLSVLSPVSLGFILKCYSPVRENSITISSDCGQLSIMIKTNWEEYPILLASHDGRYNVEVKELFDPPMDNRKLGICLRDFRLLDFAEKEKIEFLDQKRKNAELNLKEFQEGKTVLASYPSQLAIASEKRCNIGEEQPCAYCDYLWNIEESKLHKWQLLSVDNMSDYGGFLKFADKIVDCSIGEPFVNPQFSKIIQILTIDKKFSFTTNGQFLTKKNRKILLGKNIDMYVSIDAASAESYSHYRNRRFNDVIRNLTALCEEKKRHENLPIVYVSFLVMNSNKSEVEDWIRTMHKIGVDCLILSRLNKIISKEAANPVVKNDYLFDYLKEIISDEVFDNVINLADKLSKQLGIKLINRQEHFVGQTPKNEKQSVLNDLSDRKSQEISSQNSKKNIPICSEPWLSAYCLSKGISPCCYSPMLATWDEKPEDMHMKDFIHKVFNGKMMQDIRNHLAQGTFSKWCLSCKSCPVVAAYCGEVKSVDIYVNSRSSTKCFTKKLNFI